jgi:cation transport protein ChaC
VWIFGYGSLMFDGWECEYDCINRKLVTLAGYKRIFNKKSVGNWGTKNNPGLTLNLTQADEGTCYGVGFEFADDSERRNEMLEALGRREACGPREVRVCLEDRLSVALVYIYEGPRLIDEPMSLEQKSRMVLSARGKSGTCFDYVKNIHEGLQSIGLDDPPVTELWKAVQNRLARSV